MEGRSVVDVFTRDGVEFQYVREGSGPSVVVIGSATYYPRAFSRDLRTHYDLIFVDARHFLPSYAPSDDALGRLTLETFADDLEAFRAHLGLGRWTVLGHSIHAQIAVAYARKYPTRTSSLVLIAGVPYSLTELAEVQEAFWDEHASAERKQQHAINREAIGPALAAAPASRQFVVNYIGEAAKYWANPRFDSTPLWEGVEANAALWRLAESLPTRLEMRPMLESLDLPTLLVLGRLDYALPHTAWEALIDGLPWTYVLLPDDSHNPQTEAPERFDRELTRWMSGLELS